MALEPEIEELLRLSVQAACQADSASDPWLKAQLQAIANIYNEIAQRRMG